jgi:hypothetical protein
MAFLTIFALLIAFQRVVSQTAYVTATPSTALASASQTSSGTSPFVTSFGLSLDGMISHNPFLEQLIQHYPPFDLCSKIEQITGTSTLAQSQPFRSTPPSKPHPYHPAHLSLPQHSTTHLSPPGSKYLFSPKMKAGSSPKTSSSALQAPLTRSRGLSKPKEGVRVSGMC